MTNISLKTSFARLEDRKSLSLLQHYGNTRQLEQFLVNVTREFTVYVLQRFMSPERDNGGTCNVKLIDDA